jgi:hypothetical protein
VAAILALSGPAALHAATAVVTNCDNNAATSGSLPWAAAHALNAGDVIDMTAIADTSLCFTNQDGFANTILLNSAVTVADGVTINGPNGATPSALAVSGGNTTFRVFTSAGYLTINNLGIKYGKATTTSGIGGVYGGCVYAHSGMNLTDVKLDHCTATTNAASTSVKGGSVASYVGPITLTNSSVTHSLANSSNTGNAYGGGVYAFGAVTLNNSYVSGTALGNSGSAKGGGICAFGSTSGIVTLSSYSSVQSANATAASTGSALGGGIYATGKVLLDTSFIAFAHAYQNAAAGGSANGGGIWGKAGVKLTHSESVLSNAKTLSTAATADSLGGCIYSANYVIVNTGNVAVCSTYSKGRHSRGAGIYSKGLTAMHYGLISQNYANGTVSTQGGGVYSQGGLEAKYSLLSLNHSSNGNGGGAVVPAGNSYLRGASVYSNYAKSSFGALDFWAGGTSSSQIINSTISGNTANNGHEAVYIRAYATTIDNSTIAYNTSGIAGPGVYVTTNQAGSTLDLNSTLLSSNSYGSTQNDFSLNGGAAFTAGSSGNLIRSPGSAVPTGTVIGKCPLLHPLRFNGGPTPTQRLGGGISASSGSKNPAIDAGTNPIPLATDQRGGSLTATSPPRASGSAPDIGAYEVDQSDFIFDYGFEGCP